MFRLGTTLRLTYVAAWTLFTLFEVSGLHFAPPNYSWAMSIFVAVENTIVGAGLGVVVWKLSKYIARPQGWLIALIVHTIAALLYSGAWLVIELTPLLFRYGARQTWIFSTPFRLWQLQVGCIVYAILASTFHAMRAFQRLREEERRANHAEMLRVRAELEALRAKLQPHFLFNTLHTITALVRSEPARAEDALLKLGELLRYALDAKMDATEDVLLGEEWRFVQGYLAIEKIRLGERLRVEATIDEEAESCLVPIFSLQPLVENAIHHAIAPRARGGLLTLDARVRDGRLEIQVKDDGPGANLEEVNASRGLGISVVRQRFEMRFPQRTKFAITTRAGAGFAVAASVPAVV